MFVIIEKLLDVSVRRSSRNPIEMIVFFLIIASFAYASLFRSLIESDYFNETPTINSDLTKVILYPGSKDFILLTENDLISDYPKIQLKQIIIQLDNISLKDDNQLIDKVQNFKEFIEKEINEIIILDKKNDNNNNYYYYNNNILCLKDHDDNHSKCFENNNTSLEFLNYGLNNNNSSSSHLILNYALEFNNYPFTSSSWDDKISVLNFDQFVSTGQKNPAPAEKGSFLVGFAAGSLVLKIHELIQNAETIDILVILAGWILMHLTFVAHFINMQKIGSRFLAMCVLANGFFAFMSALLTINLFGVTVSPILLSEAIPFLIITNEKKSSEGVIIMGVTQKAPLIVRNYFIEIGVLFIGAMSGVNGLQEFCFLAAFILLYDCLFLFTFYTAILTLKLELDELKK
ncbi:unnamed protein product [Rhizophagus irregularis]|nr:unnamed protein product [Rhizophagus irregularis]